jgi:type I restriction enzyme S subunit
LADGWIWTNIREIAESMKNGIYKPPQFYSNSGVACLRMYNIESGSIVWKDVKRIFLNPEFKIWFFTS